MKKINKKLTLIPIKEALQKLRMTQRQLYHELSKGKWKDGYILRKKPDSDRWQYFILEEYLEWLKIDHPPVGFEEYA